MDLNLTIPDSVIQGLRLPEGEIASRLKTELAIALYAQGVLSLGKGAEMAEMSRILFGELVGRRGIPRQYSEKDLTQDIAYAGGE